jgi:hypothetical protein
MDQVEVLKTMWHRDYAENDVLRRDLFIAAVLSGIYAESPNADPGWAVEKAFLVACEVLDQTFIADTKG